jgi:hypothetical protein
MTVSIQGSPVNLQGGSGVQLQGSSFNPQQTVSGSTLQPAITAEQLQNLGGTPSASTTPPPVDTAAIQQAAKANTLKKSIQSLVSNIHSVYDAIYGSAQAQGAEKVGQINQNFGTQQDALTDTFNGDLNTNSNNFAARGAYDSSYRIDNEGRLVKQFNNNQDQLASQKRDAVAAVGQAVQGTQAGITADKSSLDRIVEGINASTDPTELQTVLNTIQDKLGSLQSGQSAYNTTAQNIAAAPVASNNLESLQASLNNIVSGSAPAALKLSVGTKLIQSAGLSDADAQDAIQKLQSALSGSGSTDPNQTTGQ